MHLIRWDDFVAKQSCPWQHFWMVQMAVYKKWRWTCFVRMWISSISYVTSFSVAFVGFSRLSSSWFSRRTAPGAIFWACLNRPNRKLVICPVYLHFFYSSLPILKLDYKHSHCHSPCLKSSLGMNLETVYLITASWETQQVLPLFWQHGGHWADIT